MAKHYTREFKLNAIKLVLEENKKVAEAAKELQLIPQTLHKWVKQYKENRGFVGSGNNYISEKRYIQILEQENGILKKAKSLENNKEALFEFIHENKKNFSISRMCEVLEVSTSGYYKWARNVKSSQEREHHLLTRKIKKIFIQNGPHIGSPFLTKILAQQGIQTSQATVSRILKDNKKDWITSHTAFHQEKDVLLHFPNKDTIWNQQNNKFYHEELAKNEIEEMLSAPSFNMTKISDEADIPISKFKDTDNLLIRSENLIGLHYLQSRFKNKVKLIYIDPPFNTSRYDLSHPDYFSHTTYLVFLKNRLEAAKPLLRENGSIWIHCNDKEQAYIKVLCDQIFGRENFVNQIVWKRTNSQQNQGHIANVKDYIIVFAKNKSKLKLNNIPPSDKALQKYKYNDHKGTFRLDPIKNTKNGYYSYKVTTPTQIEINGKWNYPKSTFDTLQKKNLIYWSNKDNIPYKKVYLTDNKLQIPTDLWENEYGTSLQASTQLKKIFPNHNFNHPKPEALIKHIIQLSTNEKDTVLDFFCGSGTTATCAHKLNRQYIAIEIDTQNYSLAFQRIKTTIKTHRNSCILLQQKEGEL